MAPPVPKKIKILNIGLKVTRLPEPHSICLAAQDTEVTDDQHVS